MKIFTLISVFLTGVASLQSCDGQSIASGDIDPNFLSMHTQQFSSIYEPSAALSLNNGNILIAEDESAKPFTIIRLTHDGGALEVPLPGFSGAIDDIEGLAGDARGNLFAVTSHSRTQKGKKQLSRNKFIRFTMNNTSIAQVQSLTGLRGAIFKRYDVIDDAVSRKSGSLNIEGLSYRREDGAIMFGLRTPVIKDRAVIVLMENPEAAFDRNESVRLSKKPVFLDLDKGGIRAISFDDHLGGYIIISRREDKKNTEFKLWLWDGEKSSNPKRLKFKTKINIEGAEGITPIRRGKVQGIIVTLDNGNRLNGTGANYVFIPYNQLKIDAKK